MKIEDFQIKIGKYNFILGPWEQDRNHYNRFWFRDFNGKNVISVPATVANVSSIGINKLYYRCSVYMPIVLTDDLITIETIFKSKINFNCAADAKQLADKVFYERFCL